MKNIVFLNEIFIRTKVLKYLMGIIKINIEEGIEKQFRETAMRKFGYSSGKSKKWVGVLQSLRKYSVITNHKGGWKN